MKLQSVSVPDQYGALLQGGHGNLEVLVRGHFSISNDDGDNKDDTWKYSSVVTPNHSGESRNWFSETTWRGLPACKTSISNDDDDNKDDDDEDDEEDNDDDACLGDQQATREHQGEGVHP